MVTERLSAQALITGGVAPSLINGIKTAASGIRGLGGRFADLENEQKRLTQATQATTRDLARMGRELEALPEGSADAQRLRQEMGRLEREFEESDRALQGVNEEMQRLERNGKRAQNAFVALSAGAATVSAAIGVAVGQSLGQFERLNRVQFDFPGLSRGQARAVIDLADRFQLDEGQLADIFNETGIRIGEYTRGLSDQLGELREFGIPLDEILSTGSLQEQTIAIAEAVAGLEDAADRAAAADIASGGAGGQAILQLSRYEDGLLRLREAVTLVDPELERQLETLDRMRMDVDEVAKSTRNLRDAFTQQLAPALTWVTDLQVRAIDSATEFVKRNEGLAPAVTVAAGATSVLAGTASSVAGTLASAGEQTFYITQGFSGLSGVGKRLDPVMKNVRRGGRGMAGGFRAAAAGIRAATLASIAFVVSNPLVLAIVGISLAVAALSVVFTILADKVGGFGNLARIAFLGAKVAALEFVNILALNLRLLAPVLDGIIAAISAVKQALGGEAIEFRVGAAIDNFDRIRADARADFSRSLQAGLAEGRAQDEAGTSIGQRIGGFFGGGDEPELPETPTLAPAPAGPRYITNSGFTVNIELPNVREIDDLTGEDAQQRLAAAMGSAIARGASQ